MRMALPSGRAILSTRKFYRPPTDFELLRVIHARHKRNFLERAHDPARRLSVMVPIDIPAIADDLETDAHTVFGRLYHHLDKRYGEDAQKGKPRSAFFAAKVDDEANCVNFPLLEAVLAGLWLERRRDLWAIRTAVLSLLISVAALAVSLVTA